jgi:hypothetical protein
MFFALAACSKSGSDQKSGSNPTAQSEVGASGTAPDLGEGTVPSDGQPSQPVTGDILNGDTLTRTVGTGQGSLVQFLNPAGDREQTIVNCVQDSATASELFLADQMGGVVLFRGSTITFKVDPSASYRDGTRVEATYLIVRCI